MNFYRERVYPHLVRALGNPKPIAEIRQRILPLAQGEVLEIGVGSGVNFEHYDPTRVHKVYALEPNRGMMRLADEQRLKTRLQVEFIDLPGEQIPLADGTIDTVVSTFTLCTIPGVVDALKGLRKVLKPQGKFIFFEHGLAPDASVQQWQRRAEPLFRWAFEGCHVTRDIPRLISEAGFKIDMIEAVLQPSKVTLVVAVRERILRVLDGVASLDSRQETVVDILGEVSAEPVSEDAVEFGAAEISENDSMVVRLVNQIIVDAQRARASDIHLEPRGDSREAVIRFRIDGTCVDY